MTPHHLFAAPVVALAPFAVDVSDGRDTARAAGTS
ncbi:hypothetical protein Actkin_00738 [Actinokineospora sp. UTMC 2448]|nr:hypothetical protein Actkin_00738 [Actinokineospora sp. UTMC 2448]